MDLEFQTILYDGATFIEAALPAIPKSTAVYRIFDLHGQLIVLDKTSNLAHRLERFFWTTFRTRKGSRPAADHQPRRIRAHVFAV
jgi:excinuclease UvrABC nuclease subunit